MHFRSSDFVRYQPLVIAILTLIIFLLFMEVPMLTYSNGVFIYPHDEAYIRMAIGRNLVVHGVWGLSGEQFSPASSSLLYPLLLAAVFKLFGLRLVIPFAINLAAAIILFVVVHRWLERQGVPARGRALILVAVNLLTPVPVLVALGMEHIMQLLFTFLFLFSFADWMDNQHRRWHWKVFMWAILLTATRYEGTFIVFAACIGMLVRRRLLPCLVLGTVSAAPLVLFGIYSLRHGGYFLPTSIMIKALPIPFDGNNVWKFLGVDAFRRVFYPYSSYGNIATGRILVILLILYWLILQGRRGIAAIRWILVICLAATFLHMVFTGAALFYRYEACLVACAVLVIGAGLAKWDGLKWPGKGGGARWMAIFTTIFLFYPFFSRAWLAHSDTVTSCLDTYEQDYPAAGFIHRWYDKAAVVTDNIGITSYLSEGRTIDLGVGIGDLDIARSREYGFYRVEYAELIVRNEKPVLAVIAENGYHPDMLKKWVKVADWYTNHGLFPRPDHLSFYAIDPSIAPLLKRQLQAYQRVLPVGTRAVYP